MKTSNKLLIILALLIFITPITIIAIDIKTNYVKNYSPNYQDRQNENTESLDKKTPGRISIPIPETFTAVNFADAKRFNLEIYVQQSDQSGIKIPEYLKPLLTFSVDKNGVLNISFKDKSFIWNVTPIVIYSKTLSNFTLNEGENLSIRAISDSLNVNVSNTSSFGFIGVNANDVKNGMADPIGKIKIQHLTVNLKNANFSSTAHSYENLSINSTGQSEIEMEGDEGGKNIFSIKNLNINTGDTATLSIKNITIEKCSGRISDQTQLQMPVINLKQLFKN